MVTEKTLNTRILLKYDTLINWSNSSLRLKEGEVAIAVVGDTVTENKGLQGDITKTPIVGIKVGDGEHTFSELNWIQAIAGDVPNWAKQEDMKDVLTAIKNAIDNPADNSSLAKLKETVDRHQGYLETENTTQVTNNQLITEITIQNGQITDHKAVPITAAMVNYSDTQTVAEKIAAIDTTKATTEALNQAIAGLRDGATEDVTIASLKNTIDGVNTRIDELDFEEDTTIDTTNNFITKVKQENGKISVERTSVTEFLGIADVYNKDTNQIATVNTVTNIVTNAIIDLNETDTTVTDTFVTGVEQADGKIKFTRAEVSTALGFAEDTKKTPYGKTSNPIITQVYFTEELDKIKDLISNALRYRGTTEVDPTDPTITITPANTSTESLGAFETGDVLIHSTDTREFIYNGADWEEIGSEGIYAIKSEVNEEIGTLIANHNNLKGRVDIIEEAYDSKTEVNNKIQAANEELLTEVDDRISSAKEEIKGSLSEDIINNLDSSIVATSPTDDQYSVLTSVTQVDGKLVGKTEVTLSKVAKTGNIDDLIQTEGTCLILNCGGADDTFNVSLDVTALNQANLT